MGGFPEPMFVLGTDTQENVIYMGMGEDHPGLYRKGLFIPNADEHWVREDLKLNIGETKKYVARIRYRQPLEALSPRHELRGRGSRCLTTPGWR